MAPALVKLGHPDGQEDQCTAQQPGTIAAIAGEEGEQGQRSARHTLSQRQATKKAPMGYHGANSMRHEPLGLDAIESAEADLRQDALAGQQLGSEADDEAQHGHAAVPGFSEVDEAKAGGVFRHG